MGSETQMEVGRLGVEDHQGQKEQQQGKHRGSSYTEPWVRGGRGRVSLGYILKDLACLVEKSGLYVIGNAENYRRVLGGHLSH